MAGYYLGILGRALNKHTWVDLHPHKDMDDRNFGQKISVGVITLCRLLPTRTLCHVLSCAANAPDTTIAQYGLMLNARDTLECA